MATPAPSPYKNISRSIQDEEMNAQHLEEGVLDARARLKAASEQYSKAPGVPQEEIRKKAAEDLVNRINAVERAKSRAKEIEIQNKKPTPTPAPIEFKEGLDVVQRPEKSSLQSILDAFVPSSEAATLSETKGAPAFHPPMAAPMQPVQKAAAAVQGLRSAGVGQIGDKAQIDEKTNFRTTETKPYLIDENDVNVIGDAFRGTPEWQRQAAGLDDLEKLIGLQAQRNASKTSVDLSPLGAYLDYQNTLRGKPTNLAQGLKMAPVADTSLQDMSEVQRRRGDMAKELINTIKAAKVGQIVTQDGQIVGYTGGLNIPKPSNPSTGQARLDQSNWRLALAEKHKLFDKSDAAMGSLNTLVREMGEQIPSDLNRIQIQRAMVDMNGMRPALAEVMMEAGNQTLYNKMGQIMDKYFTKGTHLTDRDLKEFWESARSSLKALQADRAKRAAQLRDNVSGYGVDDRTFQKIVSPDYVKHGTTSNLENMPEQLPKPHKIGEAPAAKKGSLSAEDIAAIMKAVNTGGK